MMKKYSDILIVLSFLSAVISAYNSFFGENILGLAGTQWMLIALILAVYGIYAKMRMS